MARCNPERIFGRVERTPDGCWLYLGGRSSRGYGVVSVRGRAATAHRLAYLLRVGPIPPGLCVLHRCDTPRCINPEHLFLGTKGENNADRKRKGRNADRRGERNTQAKLTPEQVDDIRSLYTGGSTSQRQLADRFGICQQQVSAIVRGVAWGGT